MADLDWASLSASTNRIEAVEKVQGRLTSQLPTDVLGSPLLAQEALVALEEDVFVLPTFVGGRKLHVRVVVHWSAPSPACPLVADGFWHCKVSDC